VQVFEGGGFSIIAKHEPNAETKKIIKETNAGVDVAKFEDVKSFMDDLRK
jgi:hypothetical protein